MQAQGTNDDPDALPGDLIDLRTPDDTAAQTARVSADLANALRRARWTNQGKKDPSDVSFSSLLVGLAAGSDGTSRWLDSQFAATPETLSALLRRTSLDTQAFEALRQQAVGQLEAPETFSVSARRALQAAQQRAGAGAPIGTADVLLTMLALPGYHVEDFRSMGIDREAWARAFGSVYPDLAVPPPPATPPAPTAPPPAAAAELDLGSNTVVDHVKQALRLANALAGGAPIGPAHILAAARAIAGSGSPSFQRLQALVPARGDEATARPGPMPTAMRFEPALLAQLRRAQRPLTGDATPVMLWGRDLVAAALLCPDELVLPAFPTGADGLEQARDLWYGYVLDGEVSRPLADWTAWWREAGVALPQPRRAVYSVENDEGEDKLGIEAEAQAFARLILDKDVKPPLSIGLLGDWGSGKSFFIEKIKKNIKALADERRPELHATVVQIEFNAWHASDANLWASLVTNIFDEIWHKVSPAGDTRDLNAARERLEAQIKQARGAVHEAEAQVEIGRAALAKAEEALQHKRDLLAWSGYVQDLSAEKLQALASAAGWHEPLQTINDVDNAARALAASGNRLRALGVAMLERPVGHIAVPVILALGAAAGAMAWVDASTMTAWQQKLAQTLAAVAGVAGTVIAPLKLAKTQVDRLAAGLGRVQAGFNAQLDKLKTSDDKKQQAHAHRVERARRELESAEESVSVARTRLAELMNQQVALDPVHRLGSFLQERVQSGQYRAQQGIISLVHKDFSELSRYMKDLRDAQAAAATANGPADPATAPPIQPIDRIVLYVDDLDRCRPAHVVNMLEAVHLLLALDLFVVIVAVDSRWLTRALQVYYDDLLGNDDTEDQGLRDSTPQNYLEKIFQITYALAPMQSDFIGDYVDALAGPLPPPAGTAPAPAPTSGTPAPAPAPAPAGAPAGTAAATPGAAAGPAAASPASPASPASSAAARPARRPSRPVSIGQAERALIVRLAPLLATPRLTKRLVNVYRVIKAGKSADEVEAFDHGTRAGTCLVMLALLFGRPSIASALLRGIHEGTPPFDKPGQRLVDAIRLRAAAPGEPERITQAWQQTAELLASIGVEETVGGFSLEPQEVARYSLASGHDWHTWRRKAQAADPQGQQAERQPL
ncbi:P-loop NTPase fold protein [Pseudorhodoferax sp.]|uniref:P-loop NTPase fold protein n=1 Tax=Pseudorhodoferax sp. TaxID=1993553 RepID=UPI002DD624D4|nr:P-loop NTPase fold protein [Pseudorhodoferax sp.]